MTQTEMKEIAQALGEDDRCPICRNTGQIDCPSHQPGSVEDGGCYYCDSPDEIPGRRMCFCQD